MNKLKVIHFQRKPRPGFNYSIEKIFENLRQSLKECIEFTVAISSKYNNGYASKFFNIVEAFYRQDKTAVSHITGETHFLNLFMQKKINLLTIHDCRFMERKQGIEKKIMQWLYLIAPVHNTNYVVTVSESTKKDVIKYTNCNSEKIKVIPNAISSIFQPCIKRFNAAKPVILQIGTAENKNLERLAEALNGIPCHLVVIGNLSVEQAQILNDNKIHYTNKQNLSEEALYEEYKACDILSFVSTFEGFGMPIIEANCVERVVITSNIFSMPEVAGDAACPVDPYNVDDIRKGILKLINDDAYREQLIVNGRKNKLRFNGDVIAEQYYQLYKKIAEEAGFLN